MSDLRKRLFLDTSAWERGAERARGVIASFFGWLRGAASSVSKDIDAAAAAAAGGVSGTAKQAEAHIKALRKAATDAEAELKRIENRRTSGLISTREADKAADQVRGTVRRLAETIKRELGGNVSDAVSKAMAEALQKVDTTLEKAEAKTGGFFTRLRGRMMQYASWGTSIFGTALVAGMIRLNATIEQTKVTYQTLLDGSSERADRLLGKVQEMAAKTPYAFDELATSVRLLLAFGGDENTVVDELTRLGDVASLTQTPIKELADLYGKMRVQGRLYQQDINQLTGRGIPIIQELQKQFGLVGLSTEEAGERLRKMTEDGRISFRNLEIAFANMTKEGGRFSGGMEAQSKTFLGMLSTAKDYAAFLLRDVGEKVFLALKGDLESVVKVLEQGDLSGFVDKAANAIAAFYNGLKTAARTLYEYRGAISTALTVIVTYWTVSKAVAVAENVLTTARRIGTAVQIAYRTVTLLMAAAQALFTGNTLRAAAAIRLLDASMKTTAIGAVISLVVSAAAYMLLFRDNTDEATRAIEEQARAARELGQALREATGAQLVGEYERVRIARDDARRQADANDRVAAAMRERGEDQTQVETAEGTVTLTSSRYSRVVNDATRARNTVRQLDADLADADRRIANDAGATMQRLTNRITEIEHDRTKSVEQRRRETASLRQELAALNREVAATRPPDETFDAGETAEEKAARQKAERERRAADRKQAREAAAAERKATRDATKAANEAEDRLKKAREDLRDLRSAALAAVPPTALRGVADALTTVTERADKAKSAVDELTKQSSKLNKGELAAAQQVQRAVQAQQTALEREMRRLSALPGALRRGEGEVLGGFAQRLAEMATQIAEAEGALVTARAEGFQQATSDLEARHARLQRQMAATEAVAKFVAGLGEDVRERIGSTASDLLAEAEREQLRLNRLRVDLREQMTAAAHDAAVAGADEITAVVGGIEMPELVVEVAARVEQAEQKLTALQRLILLVGSVAEDTLGTTAQRYREAAEAVDEYAQRTGIAEAALARAEASGDTAGAERLRAIVQTMRDRLSALTEVRNQLRTMASPADVEATDLDLVVGELQRAAQNRMLQLEVEVIAGTRTQASADEAAAQISEALRQKLLELLQRYEGTLPAEALAPIRQLVQAIGQGYDPLRRSRQEAEKLRDALREMAGLGRSILDLGRALGVVDGQLEGLIGGAIEAIGAIDNLVETRQRLKDKEQSAGRLSMGDELARAGAYAQVLVAGASMVMGFIRGLQAQREEARRLEQALRDAARTFRQATQDAFAGGRVGEGITPEALAEAIAIAQRLATGTMQGQDRARAYDRLAELGVPGVDELIQMRDDLRAKMRDDPLYRNQFRGFFDMGGSFDSAEMNKAIDDILFGDGIYRGRFGTIDFRGLREQMLGPEYEAFAQYLERLQSQLGSATGDIAGAIEKMRFFADFMGGDATAQLGVFLDSLGSVTALPAELAARLATIQGLDLKTAEGRKTLEAFYQALAADLEAGRLATGGLSREEIEKLLETLKGLSSGEGSDADEYTRGVSVARSITELQGSEVIILLESIDETLRRIAEASGVGLGLPAGTYVPAVPISAADIGKTMGREPGATSPRIDVTIGSVALGTRLDETDFDEIGRVVGRKLYDQYRSQLPRR